MKIQILNVPHLSIGSRLAGEHLPPLGLLSIAGPLIDQGHEVKLLDAEFGPMSDGEIVHHAVSWSPDCILMGHSGSSSAQPVIERIARLIKGQNPLITIIIGGVFPTFHWRGILLKDSPIDYIIRGEGEETTACLVRSIAEGSSPDTVRGIAFVKAGAPVATPAADTIEHPDDYRIAWELIRNGNYTYWGKRKAVVIQFSRGCPYPCIYCGQNLFWKTWRHRDPLKLADEMEMLHRQHGVEVFNFADENPASVQKPWIDFLKAIIRKKLDIALVGSIRADHIVRDAQYLHLYKEAGFERFLLGIESYNHDVLLKVKKSGSPTKDMEAIQLLRHHGILSMATCVIGLEEEKIADFYHSFKQLLLYDPDQIQMLYATPHRWTPYYEQVREQDIIFDDLAKWDYKHQVLSTCLKAWQVIICVKLIEFLMQARPKALARLFFHREAKIRRAMRWYTAIGKRVWFHELWEFFFRTKLLNKKMTVAQFWEDK